MMPHWLPVALLTAFLSMDETALGQFMVSRPIVTGPLVGWLLGRPDIGLEMGALVELIWIGDMPVGAHLPLNLTMLASISVALSCELVQGRNPEAVMTYALGLAIPLAALSTEAEIALRKFHIRWLHFAQRMAFSGHFKAFEWLNYLVVAEQLLKGFLTAAAALCLAHWGGGLYALLGGILGGKVIEGFYYAHWLLLALGCSALIDLMVEKSTVIYLVLSIVTGMSLAIFFQVQGVYLVSLALAAGFILTLLYMGKREAA